MRIFLSQFWEFLWFFDSIFKKILDFDRNNLYTHFCFSELLILIEKMVCGFSFGPLEYQKKILIFKKYWKTPYRRVAHKRYNFALGAANHTFFWLTLYFNYCNIVNISKVIDIPLQEYRCQKLRVLFLRFLFYLEFYVKCTFLKS